MMNLILFLIVNVVFCYMATVGFGVILNIPRRGLNACGIVGVIGWLVYVCIKDCFSSSMLANLLAAFSIGMGAMFCARFKKMPMILFIQALSRLYREARHIVPCVILRLEKTIWL